VCASILPVAVLSAEEDVRCVFEELCGLIQHGEGGYEEERTSGGRGEGGCERLDVGGCCWEVEVHLRGHADEAVRQWRLAHG